MSWAHEPGAARPTVAVVGRPNVGKSTLVNRIVGRRVAIVEEHPGVTRDRKPLDAEWNGRSFVIVDTGGWSTAGSTLDRQVSAQAELAMKQADVILLVVDVTTGITIEDDRVARLLRRAGQRVLVAVNKVDGEQREPDVWLFSRLGLGDPYPVSALHGRGSGDLLDAIVAAFPPVAANRSEVDGLDELDSPAGLDGLAGEAGDVGEGGNAGGGGPRATSVVLVGRPNVGKSTLFNRLIGDERSVVHDLPGTTRDTIDTLIELDGLRVRIIDTAGMRKRAREAEGAEFYSLVRALEAIDRADLAILVIDATAGVTRQDQRLAERVDAAGSPIVVVLNKWDLLDAERRALLRAEADDRLGFLTYAPVLPLSALTGRGVARLAPALSASTDAYRRRVPTAELNRVVALAQSAHASPQGRVLYATQGATDPPTFTLFTTSKVSPTYLRYLERKLREHFDFGPTPLKFRVRRRGN